MPKIKKNDGAGSYPTRYSWKDKIYQPPFDARTTRITYQGKHKLEAGRLIVAPSNGTHYGYMGYLGLRFLYNPSEIALAYTANADAPPPANVENALNVGNYLGSTGSLSFSLLFDRTYDTWAQHASSNNYSQLTRRYGVYVDVRQFYLMCGMLRPFNPQGTNGNPATTGGARPDQQGMWNIRNYELQSSPMVPVPMQVYFGGKMSLTYYGRITGFNVTYTHFTSQMTPNRCVINVSMQTWIKPKHLENGGVGGDAGGGTDSSSTTTTTTTTTPNPGGGIHR